MTRLGNLMRTFMRQPTGTVPTHRPEAGTGRASAESSIRYAPDLDGAPDPGEVVWAWVSYDDDPAQGKDRPVLLIGHEGSTYLGLQLTSQDHDLDAEDEARYGRYWMDIGTGDWDRERRPSEVRLDRLLRLEESDVRREGAVLDREMFDAVVREAHRHHDF